MSKENEERVRGVAIHSLEKRGYNVRAIGSGSGVPKSSRLAIRKPGGPDLNCVVKVTTNSGRISFVHDDGKGGKPWGPLSNMDYVLYVHAPDDGAIRVQLFKRQVIEDAFNTLHDALDAEGKGHIPHWLAPFAESGVRFTGSGFGDRAEWTDDFDAVTPTTPLVGGSANAVADAIATAKEIVANALGRSPAEIDLTISFRS